MRCVAFAGDWPITQQFGLHPEAYAWTGQPGHNGTDFGCPSGTTVCAPEDGTISEVGDDLYGWGHYVKVQARDGGCWLLAHLGETGATAVGDWVVSGTPLGATDNTGNSTGPHLHIGYRPLCRFRDTPYNGWVDPLPFLERISPN